MLRELLSRDGLVGEKPRFLVVGAVNTFIGYLLFLTLLATLGARLQALSGYSSPVVRAVGPLLHRGPVGRMDTGCADLHHDHEALRLSEQGALGAPGGACLPCVSASRGSLVGSARLTVQMIGLTPQVGLLVVVAITTVLTYLAHKYFTFRVPFWK